MICKDYKKLTGRHDIIQAAKKCKDRNEFAQLMEQQCGMTHITALNWIDAARRHLEPDEDMVVIKKSKLKEMRERPTSAELTIWGNNGQKQTFKKSNELTSDQKKVNKIIDEILEGKFYDG